MRPYYFLLLVFAQHGFCQDLKTSPPEDRFLGYTEWQNGSISLGPTKTIPVSISYDLLSNDIRCQIDGEKESVACWPDTFTIEGESFIGLPDPKKGRNAMHYFQVIYQGRTRLLKAYKAQWAPSAATRAIVNALPKTYTRMPLKRLQRWSELYIWEEGSRPRLVSLARRSVVNALTRKDATAALNELPRVPSENDLVYFLKKYDAVTEEPVPTDK